MGGMEGVRKWDRGFLPSLGVGVVYAAGLRADGDRLDIYG